MTVDEGEGLLEEQIRGEAARAAVAVLGHVDPCTVAVEALGPVVLGFVLVR
ncbi:MAG: hypothetical protein R2991_16230 [Thermoanaerobaculia bacterium]